VDDPKVVPFRALEVFVVAFVTDLGALAWGLVIVVSIVGIGESVALSWFVVGGMEDIGDGGRDGEAVVVLENAPSCLIPT